jgi:hypothetical protein
VQEDEQNPLSALRSAAHSFSVDRDGAEVATALEQASIPTVLVKGAAIATWLYSGERPRLYTDTDLLLPKRDWEAAKTVMKRLGFEDDLGPLAHPRMESGEGYPWARSDGAAVDLHYTLFGVGADPEMLWEAFWTGAVRERVGGVEMAMPSYPARLLHIALHVVQHGGKESSKSMTDLELALAKVPQDTWREASDLARRLEATEAFAAGLDLLPEGRALAAAIGAEPTHSAGPTLRLQGVPLAEGFQELSEARGLRAKVAILAHELFPNRAFMRWWTPLARRGWLGLGLAYVWRLIWLAYRAIPGFLAWRRVARRKP